VLCGRQLRVTEVRVLLCGRQLPVTEVRVLQNVKEFYEYKYKRGSSATKNIQDGRLSNLLSVSGSSLLRTAQTAVRPRQFPTECAFFYGA